MDELPLEIDMYQTDGKAMWGHSTIKHALKQSFGFARVSILVFFLGGVSTEILIYTDLFYQYLGNSRGFFSKSIIRTLSRAAFIWNIFIDVWITLWNRYVPDRWEGELMSQLGNMYMKSSIWLEHKHDAKY